MKDLPSYRYWGYAATFGALWGAVEITVGSFLHAMKLPFSSVVLAGVGAALLVAMRTILPVRGVVVTAGAVCAGVKLLSPAGAVIGPMIAILMESLLVELALSPCGANPLSGAAAGVLPSGWSVAQRRLNQALFYGMPMIGIYKGVLKQSERALHLPASGGAWAAGLFLLVVALLGGAFGAMGALVGRAAKHQAPPQEAA